MLKSTLGRSERDVLVVLRRKLAAEINAGNVRSAAMAALIRQFRDVDAKIRAIDAAASTVPTMPRTNAATVMVLAAGRIVARSRRYLRLDPGWCCDMPIDRLTFGPGRF